MLTEVIWGYGGIMTIETTILGMPVEGFAAAVSAGLASITTLLALLQAMSARKDAKRTISDSQVAFVEAIRQIQSENAAAVAEVSHLVRVAIDKGLSSREAIADVLNGYEVRLREAEVRLETAEARLKIAEADIEILRNKTS